MVTDIAEEEKSMSLKTEIQIVRLVFHAKVS
jgi:hypothetical protein